MKLDIKTLFLMQKQLRYILTSRQKKHSIVVFVLMLITAMLETLGVTAIMPFVYAILEPEKLFQNQYIALIVSAFSIRNASQLIVMIGIAIIVVYLVKGFVILLSSYIQIRFRCNFQKDLSIKMLTSYMNRPYMYFVDNSSATILRGIGSDVNSVFALLENIFSLISEGLTFILIVVMIIVIDPLISAAILIVAIVCVLSLVLFFKRRMRETGEKFRVTDAEMLKYSYQSIMAIKEILVMRRQENFIKKYKDAYVRRNKCDIDKCFINLIPHRFVELVFVVALIGTILIRIVLGANAVDFVPQLSVIALAAVRILPSVSNISASVNNIIYARPALEAAYNNLVEADEYEQIRKEDTIDETKGSYELKKFSIQLEMKSVCWKYNNTAVNVLENASLIIKKGESVAFVGESGAGKTTAMDIILGLLRPQNGSVLMDGIDVFTIPRLWAKEIGYVPQNVFLVDDTIRANIAFGIDESEIDDKKVWRALEQAQLKQYVEESEHGLYTIVGERGVRLSGGQRQRISIARALYYEPEILILDEATAALDNETETAVMESIDALKGNKTLIIVAHRLSTIKNCNVIYEVKDKQVIKRDKQEVLE